ncbi:MAG: hypothetical protein II467_04665 [Bacilli bacterium]|nr:hypothetical protein [Bacilli bacterium]MBQ4255179.1 hypothetical protein [Bacilli bacterium]
MAYNNALDGLPRILKILIAIFLSVLYTVYMVIRDIMGKKPILVVVLDVLFGTILGFVNWIINIVFIIKDDKVVDYSELFNIK